MENFPQNSQVEHLSTKVHTNLVLQSTPKMISPDKKQKVEIATTPQNKTVADSINNNRNFQLHSAVIRTQIKEIQITITRATQFNRKPSKLTQNKPQKSLKYAPN